MSELRWLISQAWRATRRNLGSTFAGVLTVAVAFGLLGGALVLGRALDAGANRWRAGVSAEIFMAVDATRPQVDAVRARLRDDPRLAQFQFLDHDTAWDEFVTMFAHEPDLLATVRPSDLPQSFRIRPRDAADVAAIVTEYRSLDGVDEVVTPLASVQRFVKVTGWVRTTSGVVGVVLAVAGIILIVNAVRLATFARRREIEIMRLVGADAWLVRMPFLIEGGVQGLVGGVGATGLVWATQAALAAATGSDPELATALRVGPEAVWAIAGTVVVAGLVVGTAAAAVGVRRFVRIR